MDAGDWVMARQPARKPKQTKVEAPAKRVTRRGPAWSRRADARPDEILDAALAEFIAKGFDAARMEDIAARAGISKGAVYLYFPAKESLLRALIEREVKPVFANVQTMVATIPDPKAAIKGIATMIMQRMADPRLAAIPFLVISIANRFPELAHYYRKEVVEPAKNAMEALVERGIAMGQFRKVEPRAVVRALAGPLMFEVIWAHGLKGPSYFTQKPPIAETQFDLLMRGLEAEKPR
jgi:AcrR family transcriptional regulator